MTSNDPSTLIYSIKKEYEENIENSGIFKEFESRVPKFDEGQKSFCDLENQKDSRIFYIELMKLINKMYKKDLSRKQTDQAKQDFIEKLSGTLSKNSKHFSFSVVSIGKNEKKRKTVAPSSQQLYEKLTRLAKDLIKGASAGSRESASPGKSRDGSISHICSLLKEINKSLSSSEKKAAPLSRPKLISLINELSTDELRDITVLISKVAIHNKIRDYFYNATKVGNENDPKAARNKTISTLDSLAREIALPVSKIAKLADDKVIEGSMEKLLEAGNAATSTYIPVTADCFGNVIIIAGRDKLTARHKIGSNKACRYIIMKQAFQSNLNLNLTHDEITLTLTGEDDVFDEYEDALIALQFVTTDHIDKIREKYYEYLPKDVFDAHDLEELMQQEDIRKQKDRLKKEWLKEM